MYYHKPKKCELLLKHVYSRQPFATGKLGGLPAANIIQEQIDLSLFLLTFL